jgi:O-antigen/teichoic acid export membrane protein
MSFTRSFAYIFLGQESALLFNLLNAVLLARTLGAEGVGTYALVVASAQLIAQAGGVGLNFANTYVSAKDRSVAGKLLVLSFLPVLLVIGPAALAASGSPGAVDWFFGSLDSTQRALTWAGAGIMVAASNLGALQTGMEAYRSLGISTALGPIGITFTNAVGILVLGKGLDWALAAWLIWSGIAVLVAGGLLIGQGARPSLPGPELMRRCVGVAFRALLNSVLWMTMQRGMLLLVDRVLGRAAVGHFSVAFQLAGGLQHVPSALGSLVFTDAATEGGGGRARVASLIRLHLLLTGTASLILSASSPLVIPALFGSRFGSDLVPFVILVAGYFVLGVWTLCSADYAGRHGYPMGIIGIMGGALALSMSLAAVWMGPWGLRGAAAAWSSAVLLASCCMALLFLRDSKGELGLRSLWPRLSDLGDLRRRCLKG